MDFNSLMPYLDYSVFVLIGLYFIIQFFYKLDSRLATDSAEYKRALEQLWEHPEDEELKSNCFTLGMHYYYEMDSSASYVLNGFDDEYLKKLFVACTPGPSFDFLDSSLTLTSANEMIEALIKRNIRVMFFFTTTVYYKNSNITIFI